MAVSERVAPYVEQALDNERVHENVRRAVDASRGAYARARSKKRKTEVLRDRRMRRRAREAVKAVRDATAAVVQARRRRRRRRRARIFGIVVAAAGLLFAVAQGRRLLKLLYRGLRLVKRAEDTPAAAGEVAKSAAADTPAEHVPSAV
jgi:hypothetical protein